jgi:tmRNA-binding protein
VEIALAQGKKLYDKRRAEKEKQVEKELRDVVQRYST